MYQMMKKNIFENISEISNNYSDEWKTLVKKLEKEGLNRLDARKLKDSYKSK